MRMARAGRKKKNVKKINKRFRIVIAVLACMVLAGVSITVYSKYYKTGYNKGMAIASSFYFSSNYMAALDNVNKDYADYQALMEYIAETYTEDSIITSTNSDPWSGEGACTFYVKIRNYDNYLLYNDIDLNVDYRVNFMLLEDPQGAVYTVSDSANVSTPLKWENGKGTVASFTGKLPGGTSRYDEYQLKVTKPDNAEYIPANVLMVAYPIGPSYLTGTKCIAGIISAKYKEREFNIEKQGFTIVETADYQQNWRKAIEKEAGFEYQLITSGSFSSSDSMTARKKIKLKWNSKMFQINANDEYYLKTQDPDNPEGTYSISTVPDENGIYWGEMEIEISSYYSVKFVFFRNTDVVDAVTGKVSFEQELENMKDREEFEKSIYAEVLDGN